MKFRKNRARTRSPRGPRTPAKKPQFVAPIVSNEKGHVRPKIGKSYGYKFGAKLIKKLWVEDDVPMVTYINGDGSAHSESLTMFNRWAFMKNIAVP